MYGTDIAASILPALVVTFTVLCALLLLKIAVLGFDRFWSVQASDKKTAYNVPAEVFRVPANRFDALLTFTCAFGAVASVLLRVRLSVCCFCLVPYMRACGC